MIAGAFQPTDMHTRSISGFFGMESSTNVSLLTPVQILTGTTIKLNYADSQSTFSLQVGKPIWLFTGNPITL